jgi:hypothetical protein
MRRCEQAAIARKIKAAACQTQTKNNSSSLLFSGFFLG